VAVLGGGVDNADPREQRTLMEAMLARGGIVFGASLVALEARELVRQALGKQLTRRSGFQGPGARHYPGGNPWPNHPSS
jgi:hypothetical protein